VKPLYDPEYDRLWAVLQDLEIPVNVHAGTGSPNYGRYASVPMIMIAEVGFYGMRPFVHLLLSGVFERFPRLKFVFTEGGASWLPETLRHLDYVVTSVQKGSIGELKYTEDQALPRTATEYFNQNVWMGVSFPKPADLAVRSMMGPDRYMWGSDYPHDEGTQPYTREHLRQVTQDVPDDELRRILGYNAAALYDFDLEALAPLARQHGPTPAELREPLVDLPEKPNRALLQGRPRAVSAAAPV
jgi:predicted TIM-barrel fold metal-dependent hydrolase